MRRKGQAAAQKKAQREATEGLIGHYLHAGGKIAVLVEINCESDFVARTDDFQRLCHDVAMHVAALDPRYVRREEVTPQILDHEREIYREQARATGKPEPVIEKIVTGKMEKFYEENCLYEQHFIKDESVTVGELIAQMVAKLGENISVRRFVRLKVGETAPLPASGAISGAPSAPSESNSRAPRIDSLPGGLHRLTAKFGSPRAAPSSRKSLLECPPGVSAVSSENARK